MPDQASPSARINPVFFTVLLIAALAGAALVAASLSSITSGVVRNLLPTAGSGQNGALAAEQRRQARALEDIELSLGRIRTDVVLLNERVSEAQRLYREAVDAATARPTPGNPAWSGGPAFELDALRASFDGTVDGRPDARRQNPQPGHRWRAVRGATAIPARTAPSA